MGSKIEFARLLCSNKENQQNFLKGVNILESLSFSNLNSSSGRTKALETLAEFDKNAAIDIIYRIRDSIPFILESKQDPEAEVEILSHMSSCPLISSHERLVCAVCLYNNNFVTEPLNLFLELASDKGILPSYRVEACMYLIYSEDIRYRENTIEVLKGLIEDTGLSNKIRYENIICKFNTELGLGTILNKERLNVRYDEALLFTLQSTYFQNRDNNIRYRILSGQHILQMKSVPPDVKEEVGEELLNIAKDYTGTAGSDSDQSETDIYNIRADAADIIARLGNLRQVEIARGIIKELGDDDDGDSPSLLKLKGTRTYVSDAQNVHNASINQSVNKFILSLFEEYKEHELKKFSELQKDIKYLIEQKTSSDPLKKMKAFSSLSRISIDTATFTERQLTSAEVFAFLWEKIDSMSDSVKGELQNRFVEELIDMDSTCSSGHVSRLINIFSGFNCGMDILISFKEQLRANIAARLQSLIKILDDCDIKEKIIMGMMEGAEPQDKKAFIDFISTNSPVVRDELYKEFVDAKYMRNEEFDKTFVETVNGLIAQ